MKSVRVTCLLSLSLVAACAAVPDVGRPAPSSPAPAQSAPQPTIPRTDPAPPSVGFIPPVVLRESGLESVIGKDARAVQRLFGQPRLDTPEGDARKLQFTGSQCVLDVFLYPLRPGSEAVATHVEARRASDGAEVNRASCVAALRRR